MTTFQTENQIIYFNEKFGLITDNQIIISKGKEKNKIDFESIHNVKLIKRRVFYSNSILLLIALSLIAYVYFYFETEKIEMHISLITAGFLFLIFSIFHKFYFYKLVIKEKNNSIIELKTNQIHRKSIKEFYNAIIKKISTKKNKF